jgi:hypothetical protein
LAYSCGFVLLLAAALIPLDAVVSRLPRWKVFVFTLILFYGLDFSFGLFDAAINQPPRYCLSGGSEVSHAWLARPVIYVAETTLFTAILLLLPVIIHFETPESLPKDYAYYPRLVNVWRGLCLVRVRLILIVGMLLLFAYYAGTALELGSPRGFSSLAAPPARIWISCHVLWGLLWWADCTSRVRRGMVKVAVGYLSIAIVFLLILGFGTEGP